MEKYIGVKIVEAEPCTYGGYLSLGNGPVNKDVPPDAYGYLIRYPDGYESWCPKAQFEEANRPMQGMTFGHAIEAAKKGLKIARAGWNGKGIFVALQAPDAHSKMTSPYLYINTIGLKTDNTLAPKSLVPWLASQTDMLSDDWIIV